MPVRRPGVHETGKQGSSTMKRVNQWCLSAMAAVTVSLFPLGLLSAGDWGPSSYQNPGGGARSGGVSDADRKPAPGGGKKKHKGGETRVPEDQLPSWEAPTSKVVERAAKKELPLFILFSGEDDESTEADYLHGKDIVELSKTKAVFIRVPYTKDREPSWDDGSPVPTSIILSKNPTRDYHVSVYPTMVIADWHGNEYYKGTSKPDAATLEKYFASIAELAKKSNEKLQKTLDAAKKAFEEKDRAKTLKGLLENFKTKIVGLDAQEASIKLYREIIENGRKELSDASVLGGKEAQKRLKDLKAEFKDTELVKEIDAALKEVK